jgi:BirA family biotin operon repressor/biotin-[acetyl-CoA-carboxylase] ligase
MSLPDDLEINHILKRLQTKAIGRSTFTLDDETESTNDELLSDSLRSSPHGAVAVADHQTAGRGRNTRTWFSPPGVNLLFSVLFRPPLPVSQFGSFGLAAGVALYNVIHWYVTAPARLKWPNDLLIEGKKVAGILCQSNLGENPAVVVGVGLNVNVTADEFPLELRDTVTSLRQLTGKVFDRSHLLAELLLSIETQYEIWLNDRLALFRAWEERAQIHGAAVRVIEANETYEATAQGLDDEGRLMVMWNGRPRAVACGDVHLLEV